MLACLFRTNSTPHRANLSAYTAAQNSRQPTFPLVQYKIYCLLFLRLCKLCAAEAIMFSLCPVAPMSHANIGISFVSREYTERISVQFAAGNYYHQHV